MKAPAWVGRALSSAFPVLTGGTAARKLAKVAERIDRRSEDTIAQSLEVLSGKISS